MADPSSLTDEELVELVRSKDQELYSVLVQRYETRLLRYAMTFLKDEDPAKDVVQNAFIKAFVNLQGFNTKKKFSSWMYRIVHNETINEIKRHKRELPLTIPEAQLKEDSAEHPDDRIDREQEVRMLKELLDQIPLTYRSALTLFFLEDKSYEDISDILRIPLGTVGTRISRGKRLLHTLYDKQKHS